MAPLGRTEKVGMKAHEMDTMDMDLFVLLRDSDNMGIQLSKLT